MKNSKDHSGIAHQNKDIVSKTLGDGMQGKPLSVMGWETDLVIERIEPTNLPAVEANEMRLDNLFVLNDGSIAVIDYESTAKAENVLKYLGYVVRILRRIGIRPDTKIRVMILYTARYKDTGHDPVYGRCGVC